MIIGIGGYKQVGKNTAATVLTKKHNFVELSFAGPIKSICSSVLDLPYNQFESSSLKDTPFSTPVYFDGFAIQNLIFKLQQYQPLTNTEKSKIEYELLNKPFLTPRHILQFIGSDVVRTVINDNFWVNALILNIKNSDKNVVVTDVRLPNERTYLQRLEAKLVLIKREGYGASGHSSEGSLGNDSDYNIIINNNDAIESLHSKMENFYKGLTS